VLLGMAVLTLHTPAKIAALPRLYKCQCGGSIFFRNSMCLRCNKPLGYEPHLGRVCPLAPGPRPDTWSIIGERHVIGERHITGEPEEKLFRYCSNSTSAAGCNWLVPAENPQAFCISCRLNRTIPDLSIAENGTNWRAIELAKRSLVSTLIALGLPVKSRVTEDPEAGLAFDFLRDPAEGPHVLTGHSHGVITLNLDEADDAKRESIRAMMQEPYRTVLGHLRHEVGHYYWDRLVDQTPWLEAFRAVFGDERADYAKALEGHYKDGPPADWQSHYVSAYASAHPWEDWAETWAHYLHIVDTLEIVISFRLDIDSVDMPFDDFGPDVLVQPDRPFLNYLNAWTRFTAVLNEFSRSMGLPDFYPFVLSKDSVRKLHFVHTLVESQANPGRIWRDWRNAA